MHQIHVAYAERQNLLLDCLRQEAMGLLEVEPTDAGMHLIAWLPEDSDDLETSRRLWAAGVEAVPLSIYCSTPYPRQGLLLGFTGVRPEEIKPNVEKLVEVLVAGR